MPVPAAQAAAVATYIMKQKLSGRKRYPVVLMLEPLFRCNLACEGCGKIQFPQDILKKHLSADQSLAAAEECGAPIVSIAGGEPLIWPDLIPTIKGLIEQKRWIHLCTNALLLKRNLDKFEPNQRLAFTIHLDGLKPEHDRAVCREGVYEIAVEAIKEALKRGHRVTANCTLFNNADPQRVRAYFDEMMELGIEGLVMSPGYPYEKAPNQEIFLERDRTKLLFKQILSDANKEWRFNHSPNFLAFLRGDIDYDCTPWGNPCYNIFGWQKPCYLLGDGYAQTFKELMETTEWERYGQKGTDERCKDCMVHCGYEASAVDDTFTPRGLMRHFRSGKDFGRKAEYSETELAVINGAEKAVAEPKAPQATGCASGGCGCSDAERSA